MKNNNDNLNMVGPLYHTLLSSLLFKGCIVKINYSKITAPSTSPQIADLIKLQFLRSRLPLASSIKVYGKTYGVKLVSNIKADYKDYEWLRHYLIIKEVNSTVGAVLVRCQRVSFSN